MTVEVAVVPTLPKSLAANPVLARWVRVLADGRVELQVGKVEFGQGILTALAQIAADELDVELSQVTMVPASTDGPDEGLTAGSMSVLDSGPAVRLVCANVRAVFVACAARRWRLEPGSVSVTRGSIAGPEPGQLTSYGDLTAMVDLDRAADPGVTPKTVDEAALVGFSASRLDLPDKIAGRPRFIHDVRLPGQRHGRVIRPPSPGATLTSVEDIAQALGGDVQVVRDGSFLGVVGDDEAEVMLAAAALAAAASWQEQTALPDEDDLSAYLRAGPHDTVVVSDTGPAPPAARSFRATYGRPFLAHASIAPSCGIARWDDDGTLSVWSHSQGIFLLRAAIAQALRIDPAHVTVTHVENAGCYGHNGADDAAFDAVLLARSCPGRPVLVQWSRADELTCAPFGSAMTADVQAGIDETGALTSWTYDVWSQGHTSRPCYAGAPGLLAAASVEQGWELPPAADPPLSAGGGTTRNAVPIYDIESQRIRGHRLLRTSVRTSAMRALGAFMNVFAIESFMDELALGLDVDPLEFRLRNLSDVRARVVLETAAAAAGWGTAPLAEGTGRGIGLARYKGRGAYCAVVADVEAEHDIRVRRLSVAVDVGRVVNPDGVRNQIEGGATQATSWTLKERVRFDRRRITSADWETYPLLRFSEAPEVAVELVSRPDLPSVGAGEAAQGPTAAAIANAVTAALGVRVRDLPLTTDAVVAAIESSDH